MRKQNVMLKKLYKIILFSLCYKKLSNNILCCAIANQCDIDKEEEDVNYPYMTISIPVATSQEKKCFRNCNALNRNALCGMEPMNHIPEEDQCDMDKEAEDVDYPYMTILTPVATSATRKRKNVFKIATFARNALDGMEPVNRSPEEYSQIIIRMLASIQVQLHELLQKMERGRPMFSRNIDRVTSILPLKSIAEIEAFDKTLHENPEVKKQFNTFVRKIGGHTAREDIQRTCTKPR
ncbi:uncharacterized protein LOC118645415 [Monomorium pharaonis]|uniref:uncharacterized protein LOC118645415 n=1 Tax=Monomorium pharaonis TaxID=307658 RepID=UPI001746892C|nr:uncharacterized protein LOC118645415 [Monomorium pharaonis]